MAVSPELLGQLLALDEASRVEVAHTLLESVDAATDDELGEDERERLYAALERSAAQANAGQTVPFDDVIAALRAKRAHAAR